MFDISAPKISTMRIPFLFYHKLAFAFVVINLLSTGIRAQPNLEEDGLAFNNQLMPRIDILIEPDALELIYEDIFSDFEHPATFIFSVGIEKDTIENIGFRLRGNFSRGNAKKNFKVSFNTYTQGGKFEGLEKMNLNANVNDPTFIRSKLNFDLLRMLELPASRTNFVELYINNDYYGIYTNTEHYDEEYADLVFRNKEGNLYKCSWPATLEYISDDPTAYDFGAYELRTNHELNDRTDLANFIDVLNNTPSGDFECELEKVFNIQDYLKYAALEVMTGHWDGYIYNKNNYYLYFNKRTGLFEYIPYDLDNTFGIDWLNQDWGTRNIYAWSNSSEPRPLFTRLMDNSKYRNQYTAHIQRIIDIFQSQEFEDHIFSLKSRVQSSIESDPFYSLDYGYTITDFNNAFSQGLPGNSPQDDDYGILDFMSTRAASAQTQLESNNAIPVIQYLDQEGGFQDEDISVSAKVKDEGALSGVVLEYRINGGSLQESPMLDDGQGADQTADDGFYSVSLSSMGIDLMEYRIKATDDLAAEALFPSCGFNEINLVDSELPLHINEYMASNDFMHADEFGEFDDWIEIYNSGDEPINMANIFLTDNLDIPNKYQFPDVDIPSKGFLLVWADDDTQQGEFHAAFKLSASGESIGLFENAQNTFLKIDALTYENALSNVSYGCLPDGVRPIGVQPMISPGASNGPVAVEELAEFDFNVFPNPGTGIFFIQGGLPEGEIELSVHTAAGRLVYREILDSNQFEIDLSNLSNGIYVLNLAAARGLNVGRQKIVIHK